MAITKIEWAHYTFNPWIGCTKVKQLDGKLHPACVNCYAERDFDHRKGIVKWGKGHARHRTGETNWKKPLQWNKKVQETGLHRVFCASLSDVFDSEVEQSWRDDLWKLIDATPNLEWLILTKRPINVMLMIPPEWKLNPPKNVMLGTSVSDQQTADEFIPPLLSLGHLFRLFVSVEPLLGAMTLKQLHYQGITHIDALNGKHGLLFPLSGECAKLSWTIVGGESGPKARPMHPDWVRKLRDECVAANVPFHFKQWGEFAPRIVNPPINGANRLEFPDKEIMTRVGKKAAGRLLDGVEWNQYPEVKR